MAYRVAADLVLVVHLAFIAFVVLGALAVVRWPRAAWLHVPAAMWGAGIMLGGWLCPLTPLEQRLRIAAGQDGYTGGFIEHYLVPLIYPAGIGRGHQLALGLFVLVLNGAAYGWVLRRSRARALAAGARPALQSPPVPSSHSAEMASPSEMRRRTSAVAGLLLLGAALLAAATLLPLADAPAVAMGSAVLRDLAAVALFTAGTLALIWRRRLAAGPPLILKRVAYGAAVAVIGWRVVLPLVGGLIWLSRQA